MVDIMSVLGIFLMGVLMVKKQKNLDECKVVGNVFDNKELLDEL